MLLKTLDRALLAGYFVLREDNGAAEPGPEGLLFLEVPVVLDVFFDGSEVRNVR